MPNRAFARHARLIARHHPDPDRSPVREDLEDALLDGDRTVESGTARAALRYPTFRRVFFGALLSNIGSWMQNVILGAYVYKITDSPTAVAAVTVAGLGPLLLLSLVGGALADRYERRLVLILVSVQQGIFSLGIAWMTAGRTPSLAALLVMVFAIGIGQAVYAPTYSALIPTLVDRKDLAGAVSLNSASMNLSRVIGPAIGGVLFAEVGVSWVFVGNAITYLFIIGALWTVHLPPVPVQTTTHGMQRMVEGFRVARQDRVVGRCLSTMVLFSFFCLPIVVLLPVLAKSNLDVAEDTIAYGLLYGTFGAGAVAGALSIGTFLAGHALERMVRLGLAGFAVTLGAFALLRQPAPAYPVVFLVGFFYFATVTSLSTVLQERLDESVRGRVMALWIMAFGGTVPLGAMLAGPLSKHFGITPIVLFGAVAAGALVWFADLRDRPHLRAVDGRQAA